MKNILRTIFIFVVGALILVSCEKKETNFAAMTKDWDPNNTTYYLQFVKATQTLVTAIDYSDGSLIDISTTIGVALIGNPLSTAITIPISVDAASTISSDMYTLSSTSITIPAGKSSGSITITSVTENMPIDVPLTFIVKLGSSNDAPTGTTLTYTMKRFKYCYTDLEALAGSYAGTDSDGYATNVSTKYENGVLYVNGIGEGWMVFYWGEPILERAWLPMVVDQVSGEFTIAKAYAMTTTWAGAPYRYEVSGSGVFDACKGLMTVTANIYYEGDADATVTVVETNTLK